MKKSQKPTSLTRYGQSVNCPGRPHSNAVVATTENCKAVVGCVRKHKSSRDRARGHRCHIVCRQDK